jgi:ribonuclease D
MNIFYAPDDNEFLLKINPTLNEIYMQMTKAKEEWLEFCMQCAPIDKQYIEAAKKGKATPEVLEYYKDGKIEEQQMGDGEFVCRFMWQGKQYGPKFLFKVTYAQTT